MPLARPAKCAIALIVAALGLAMATQGPSSAAGVDYLGAASAGIARSQRWWDPGRGWYLERIGKGAPRTLATLWGVVHLFESVDAVAIADPTPAHIAAVRSFAAGAERYWNPNLVPVPGYAASPGTHDPHHRTWYDDNGWWGMAFYDAFRATGDRSYLSSVDRALTFLDSGWDPRKGGIWWNTQRSFKAGESLAGAMMLAALLYRETHAARYLAMAQKYLGWADSGFKGSDGLYDRNEDDPTPMPYVEGPMAVALVMLCQTSGTAAYCDEGEELAHRAVSRFRRLTMGPQYDAMYVRSLLELYDLDHNRLWYETAKAITDRAVPLARGPGGVYTRTWQGKPTSTIDTPPGKLQTHAATTSILAWMAATTPPK
jgi:hypothetical protein